MNPVMRAIALWFSKTFVASALEVIFEIIIAVWNYSVVRYDLPLPCITINETNEETRNKNPSHTTIDELLQITDNLIDLSHDEIVAQNLRQIGEPHGGNVSDCFDILTSLRELTCSSNNDLEETEGSSFEVHNANDSNDIVATQDGAEQLERNFLTDVNEGNYDENALKEDLNHDHGDNSTYTKHQESSELLKECEEAETTSILDLIAGDTVQYERDIDGIIREGNLELRHVIPLNVEPTEINSACTHVVCFDNNTEMIPELHQELISNEMEGIALDNSDCWPDVGSDISLKHTNGSVQNKETEMENTNSEIDGMKSFINKQRRVKFSEEIETFIYEPGKNLHHPCVKLKSPINIWETEDKSISYQSTMIIKEVEETIIQSTVIREQEKETAGVFQENHDILGTLQRVYEGRREENNSYFSDESDTSDASLERQNRIEGWLQLTTEDDKFLLDNTYPICNCSPQKRCKEEDSKTSKTGHGHICFNKAAVTAARKQSKDILDKICKKLFQTKPAKRK